MVLALNGKRTAQSKRYMRSTGREQSWVRDHLVSVAVITETPRLHNQETLFVHKSNPSSFERLLHFSVAYMRLQKSLCWSVCWSFFKFCSLFIFYPENKLVQTKMCLRGMKRKLQRYLPDLIAYCLQVYYRLFPGNLQSGIVCLSVLSYTAGLMIKW